MNYEELKEYALLLNEHDGAVCFHHRYLNIKHSKNRVNGERNIVFGNKVFALDEGLKVIYHHKYLDNGKWKNEETVHYIPYNQITDIRVEIVTGVTDD